MDERNKAINDSLVRIYGDIMWIEENELRKSKFNDLTMREMHAIHAISMYDHKSTSEVAKELHLTPGTLTSMADRLVRKGYVIRLRSEDDRRVIRLGLTKKGRVVYRAHEAFHNMMVKSFLKDLDATEIKTIEKALWNLEQFLREHS
ncbi:MarR family winged helix-turn-helix transcriptional regulator [Ligilactobacillus saerimneri]|uniref:MarR family transcriptional regulator n=1 Tax=Ligilactobacillus saerimneri TaxID=228229 RepID=A0A7H9ELN6_9LACO|nr:MarR family transcriptional regulator [Ligilactobacillus saerimneri]KRL73496.1 MarR family transcriptional regulator [Ligilactobacillus saerimneri DSM 16049]MBU5309685.1 MarR family transcriptional regulator [Ligilactobacillus saerimneri]MCZ0892243.1 MarR family transcriptional regulator [Ligilactobacillus saerimneri]MDI9206937.1 MarR family transcriptional regulator [Ligilactobacillus saerimneri]MDY4003094.1 MarR family transcriptional regulator [Ligilactobacillus saerimneri]